MSQRYAVSGGWTNTPTSSSSLQQRTGSLQDHHQARPEHSQSPGHAAKPPVDYAPGQGPSFPTSHRSDATYPTSIDPSGSSVNLANHNVVTAPNVAHSAGISVPQSAMSQPAYDTVDPTLVVPPSTYPAGLAGSAGFPGYHPSQPPPSLQITSPSVSIVQHPPSQTPALHSVQSERHFDHYQPPTPSRTSFHDASTTAMLQSLSENPSYLQTSIPTVPTHHTTTDTSLVSDSSKGIREVLRFGHDANRTTALYSTPNQAPSYVGTFVRGAATQSGQPSYPPVAAYDTHFGEYGAELPDYDLELTEAIPLDVLDAHDTHDGQPRHIREHVRPALPMEQYPPAVVPTSGMPPMRIAAQPSEMVPRRVSFSYSKQGSTPLDDTPHALSAAAHIPPRLMINPESHYETRGDIRPLPQHQDEQLHQCPPQPQNQPLEPSTQQDVHARENLDPSLRAVRSVDSLQEFSPSPPFSNDLPLEVDQEVSLSIHPYDGHIERGRVKDKEEAYVFDGTEFVVETGWPTLEGDGRDSHSLRGRLPWERPTRGLPSSSSQEELSYFRRHNTGEYSHATPFLTEFSVGDDDDREAVLESALYSEVDPAPKLPTPQVPHGSTFGDVIRRPSKWGLAHDLVGSSRETESNPRVVRCLLLGHASKNILVQKFIASASSTASSTSSSTSAKSDQGKSNEQSIAESTSADNVLNLISAAIDIDGTPVRMELVDTHPAKRGVGRRLRLEALPMADVALICCSTSDRASVRDVHARWLMELAKRGASPLLPVIVVVFHDTASDLMPCSPTSLLGPPYSTTLTAPVMDIGPALEVLATTSDDSQHSSQDYRPNPNPHSTSEPPTSSTLPVAGHRTRARKHSASVVCDSGKVSMMELDQIMERWSNWLHLEALLAARRRTLARLRIKLQLLSQLRALIRRFQSIPRTKSSKLTASTGSQSTTPAPTAVECETDSIASGDSAQSPPTCQFPCLCHPTSVAGELLAVIQLGRQLEQHLLNDIKIEKQLLELLDKEKSLTDRNRCIPTAGEVFLSTVGHEVGQEFIFAAAIAAGNPEYSKLPALATTALLHERIQELKRNRARAQRVASRQARKPQRSKQQDAGGDASSKSLSQPERSSREARGNIDASGRDSSAGQDESSLPHRSARLQSTHNLRTEFDLPFSAADDGRGSNTIEDDHDHDDDDADGTTGGEETDPESTEITCFGDELDGYESYMDASSDYDSRKTPPGLIMNDEGVPVAFDDEFGGLNTVRTEDHFDEEEGEGDNDDDDSSYSTSDTDFGDEDEDTDLDESHDGDAGDAGDGNTGRVRMDGLRQPVFVSKSRSRQIGLQFQNARVADRHAFGDEQANVPVVELDFSLDMEMIDINHGSGLGPSLLRDPRITALITQAGKPKTSVTNIRGTERRSVSVTSVLTGQASPHSVSAGLVAMRVIIAQVKLVLSKDTSAQAAAKTKLPAIPVRPFRRVDVCLTRTEDIREACEQALRHGLMFQELRQSLAARRESVIHMYRRILLDDLWQPGSLSVGGPSSTSLSSDRNPGASATSSRTKAAADSLSPTKSCCTIA